MKLNRHRFIVERVYSWRVEENSYLSYKANVTHYKYRATSEWINDDQIFNKILRDCVFVDFFKVRKFCKDNKNYNFCWEKQIKI